jgi:hypothetical protein
MSIFTSKKVWKFLIKIQLSKSDPKMKRDGKCPPSCPRTTDAQREKSLHCTAENSLPLPDF